MCKYIYTCIYKKKIYIYIYLYIYLFKIFIYSKYFAFFTAAL